MGRLVVFENVTLDGVAQAPGRPNEDPRGGFEHGGWAVPYNDAVMGQFAAERMARGEGGALLLGRRTYQDFYSVWPNRTDNPFTEKLNNTRKYVASRTLEEPLPWMNSTLLEGDVGRAVATLKQGAGDLTVLGSIELLQNLLRANMVDEYLLLIHPLVLGTGRRLFGNGGPRLSLRLVDSKTTPTGVIIATYQPA